MPVLPAPIGPGRLIVRERLRRIEVGDPCAPPDRHAEEWPKAVLDLEAGAHPEVVGQVLESERRGRDAREVARLGEEGEHLVAGTLDDLGGAEDGHGHSRGWVWGAGRHTGSPQSGVGVPIYAIG